MEQDKSKQQNDALSDALSDPSDSVFIKKSNKPEKPKKRRLLLQKWQDLSKKQKIVLVILLSLIIAAASFAVWKFVLAKEPTQPVESEQAISAPEPTTEASRLTGLQVDPAVNKRQITGIIIENSPDARPQSGLHEADIIYEAIAEGGITRFLALYQDSAPKYIGPVRSARPYFLDWLMPFDASIAHVGGSPKALQQIRSLGLKDLDQFANSGAYERVSSRYAPHNVYTSIAKLDALEKQKGFKTSDITTFKRKNNETPAETIKAATVKFNISRDLYNVTYKYDKKNNNYTRVMGGKTHKDEKSGKTIKPKVVIALVMTKGLESDGQHTKYGTVGKNTMFVFQDGTVIKGTWKKSDRDKQFQFLRSDGTEIELNPGQTWISIVSAQNGVTYTP